jgi:V/A-type H+/Na+-transporting ATPase subunit K
MSERVGRGLRAMLVTLVATPLLLAVAMLVPALAQPGAQAVEHAAVSPEVMKWGFLAAALVTGLSALGAAYAVAVVGGAAMGAVAEKPETAGRALVFVGLAEGIAIYGLIIALMILGYLK